jgi:hypothetical protein
MLGRAAYLVLLKIWADPAAGGAISSAARRYVSMRLSMGKLFKIVVSFLSDFLP